MITSGFWKIQKALSLILSASPAAAFVSYARVTVEIRGKQIHGTDSLPADHEHTDCWIPSSQTPATKPDNSPKYSNPALCRPTT